MLSNQEIMEYLDKKGINLVIDVKCMLPESIHGLYIHIKGELPPTIVIDSAIDLSTPYGRCVLAEEIGHHETTIYKTILNEEQQTFFHRDGYQCVKYARAEKEARQWGANFLIPTDEFKEKLKEFAITGESLADYFNVTEEFIKIKLDYLLR